MNRIVQAGEVLKTFLQTTVPTATVTRTYTPALQLSDDDLSSLTIYVTPEDVRCEIKNYNGTKFTDFVTYTIAICKKVTSDAAVTSDVDTLLQTVQNIRDALLFEIHDISGVSLKLITTQAENSTSRPLYERSRLENTNFFCSFLLVEVQVNGEKT